MNQSISKETTMENKTHIPEDEDLINRYVYAVMKYLPHKNRVELEKEIRMLISDTVDSVEETSATKLEAVKIALVKLGTPDQLAAKYTNDNETCLIGGEYYQRYMMILKIVVGAAAFGMTLAMILGAAAEGVSGQGRPWYEVLGTSIASILSAVCFAFTFITVAFAIAQRKHVHMEKSGTGIDNLPPVPEHDNRISRVECIFSISFITLFFILFVTAPGFFRMPDESGHYVPVLNELRYSKKLLIVIICALALDTFETILKYFKTDN